MDLQCVHSFISCLVPDADHAHFTLRNGYILPDGLTGFLFIREEEPQGTIPYEKVVEHDRYGNAQENTDCYQEVGIAYTKDHGKCQPGAGGNNYMHHINVQ